MKASIRMRAAGALWMARRRQSVPQRLSQPNVQPDQVLVARAHRILTDGLPHGPEAIRWAARQTGQPYIEGATEVLVRSGDFRPPVFTLRELSLGAGQ